MKMMTCRQIGGPCDIAIQANSVGEMMKNAKAHMHSIDDEGHRTVIDMIRKAQKDPQEWQKWNDDFLAMFTTAPEV